MTDIFPTNEIEIQEQNRQWMRNRIKNLLPATFDLLTDSEKDEALRKALIATMRVLLNTGTET